MTAQVAVGEIPIIVDDFMRGSGMGIRIGKNPVLIMPVF